MELVGDMEPDDGARSSPMARISAAWSSSATWISHDVELTDNVELGSTQKMTLHEPHGARRRHAKSRVGWT
jgi:hypothetical protein